MAKNFNNKKVTVMGLGLHGGGVACVNWLIKHGAKVTVTDLKTKEELKPSLDKLAIKRYSDIAIKLILGRHWEIDFKNADLIIQNPGVPKESKYLEIARKAGIPIENEASLFVKNCPAKIIGVTGTRGKSTTASLICEVLRHGTWSMEHGTVWLAGLPQKPMLEILDKVKSNDLVVLELSSWQLEILEEQRLSPHIAVFTNIYPDHLNRYKGMADYIKAKKNIFINQNQNDFVILNLDNELTKKIGREVISQRFWFSKKYFAEQNGSYIRNGVIYFRRDGKITKLISSKVAKLKGEHNLENILAAATVAGIFGVKPKDVKRALQKFKGLPGRLELIKEIKGIKYINDTTATTPDGTIAALESLKHKNIILIAGGDFKNIPDYKYQQLAEVIKKTCKAVVLFSGKGSEQITKQLNFQPIVKEISNMTDAVSLAKSFAKKDDIILLSPASASFNLFVNEFDRGDQFNKIVKEL